jgi:uncharacterized protein Usg
MNQREHFEKEYPVPDREAFSELLGMYVWKDYQNTVSPHNDLYDAFRDGWQAALEAERQSKKAMSEANDRMVWGD